jgi:ABC-type multidrug transport system fused ATPase/permease subunit
VQQLINHFIIIDIGIYGAIIGAEILFSFGSIFMSVDFSIRASKSLHSGLLSKVIRAPTAFYDVTPLGRYVSQLSPL